MSLKPIQEQVDHHRPHPDRYRRALKQNLIEALDGMENWASDTMRVQILREVVRELVEAL